jgi:hypothetical protein
MEKQSAFEEYTYMCSGVHFPEGVFSQPLEMVTYFRNTKHENINESSDWMLVFHIKTLPYGGFV